MSLMEIFLGSALAGMALFILVLRVLSARRRRISRAAERAAFSTQLTVAKDLHDGPLQFLAGLALRLNMLRVAIHEQAVLPTNIDADLIQLLADIRMEQRDLRRAIESSPGANTMRPRSPPARRSWHCWQAAGASIRNYRPGTRMI